MCNKTFLTLMLIAATGLSACRNTPDSVDVVSGATTPHGQIMLPPTNHHYRVIGHLEGLNNYVVEYDPTFYRGGQIYIEDLAAEALQERSIKTIISVTPSDEERAFCKANGFTLVEIPFDKTGPTPESYARYIEALENNEPPFYIHCKGGTHRAGILGAAYRMHVQKWSLERAVVEYGRLGGDLRADHAMLETLRSLQQEKSL